jgi:hypothetical protein
MATLASARPTHDVFVAPNVNETSSSGVSWSAVIAGAFAAAALSLILLALGTGIGLSSISPWANSGATASSVGKGAIAYLIFVQIVVSAFGGYLAGRLRTKWVGVSTHEVYFRDTAHGFLAWSVGLVLTAAFLASAATSMVTGTAAAGGTAAAATTASESRANPNGYFVDSLLRSTTPATPAPADATFAPVQNEVGLILAQSLRNGRVSDADKAYVSQLVAARTGLTEPDAETRVSDVFAEAQQAADAARKAAAHLLYWTFLALLIGAFCSSYAGTIGGKERDHAHLT